MDLLEILTHVDHTLLSTTAKWSEIETLIDDAVRTSCSSVCIPPSYVKQAVAYAKGRLPVGTVIGFPNGYQTKNTKVCETTEAVENGAVEIDMVINLTDVKNGDYDAVREEIRSVKASCGHNVLKVIVETSQLTREEKIMLCRIVSEAGANFIKTSTGFAGGGATVEDVLLFKEHCSPDVRIKASGGIRTKDDADALIAAGASRLGTSRLVALYKEEEK